MDTGKLQIQVEEEGALRPLSDVTISISVTGGSDQTIEQVNTNESGQTELIELETPPLEYSMEPTEEQPYSEYTIEINTEGYAPLNISGIQLISGETSVQQVKVRPGE